MPADACFKLSRTPDLVDLPFKPDDFSEPTRSESACLAMRLVAAGLIANPYTPIGSTAASAPAASRVSFARGFSARTSTRHGISDSSAIPSAHQ